MSIGQAAFHEAIYSLWSSSGLDWEVKQFWPSVKRSTFVSLSDGMAVPGTPFPYVIFEVGPGDPITRMSGHGANEKHLISNVPLGFRVHAETVAGDPSERSPKVLAKDTAELIMTHYGGHPTATPSELVLSTGNLLQLQYQNDYGIRGEGENVYTWFVNYIALIDQLIVTG